MSNEERAALWAIYTDAGRHAEERNAAGRALGELPPLEVGGDDTPPADDQAPQE